MPTRPLASSLAIALALGVAGCSAWDAVSQSAVGKGGGVQAVLAPNDRSSGRADVRLAGKWRSVNPGDIIEIPRGSPYQFDRLGSEPAEFYLIYYPPYDGKDLRNVDGK